jgi:ectoine hydroxylase-related dioxygenase (phytanoyl-CoA dioxygenase family)
MVAFRLTAEQMALLPTDADVAHYEERGYYISREGAIPDSLLERAIRGSERFYRGERDHRLPVSTGFCDTISIDDKTPRNNEFVSLQIDELKELALYPLIGAIAARLTRSSSIRLLDDQLVWKPGDPANATDTITGWHADRAYWGTCTSDKLTTTWIPLHDIEINRAPLVVMAGSHRWSGIQDMRHFNNKNLADLQSQFRAEGKQIEIVPMTLKRGQMSFHHCWTMHASFANTSSKPRLAFAVHLQDGDNRYRQYRNAQGREVHIADEQLCRKLPSGDPDFSDPAVFPVIWSESPHP